MFSDWKQGLTLSDSLVTTKLQQNEVPNKQEVKFYTSRSIDMFLLNEWKFRSICYLIFIIGIIKWLIHIPAKNIEAVLA